MIRVEALWKEYDGRPALKGVNLSIAAGERVALVGPNGSGKTTLLRALLGLVSVRGRIRICGHDPLLDHAAALTHLAYMPQRSPALPVPVREVLHFWSAQRGLPSARVEDICRSFGLELGPLGPLRFAALSGGMQQKLLAAMALATDCPLLLLDEPTANLDPPSRAAFFSRLEGREPRPTLLLSSHRVDELRHLVNRVVLLDDGTVSYDGPVEDFLRDQGLDGTAGPEAHTQPRLRLL